MNDEQLMQAIDTKYGALIDAAVVASNGDFPRGLLAAIVANESGVNESVSRFEPGVFGDLALVLTGRKAAYGKIGAQDLKARLGDIAGASAAILAVMNLASSWGPMQIMGWQSLAGGYPLAELTNPETHFRRAVELLEDFRARFHLPVAGDPGLIGAAAWEPYFRCWNSGKPDGHTFDPNYAANGVNRMRIYEAFPY